MDFDEEEERERLRVVFGRNEVPEVTKKALREYRHYLSKNLLPRCRVTGREDFLWEEFYVYGPGDPEEYEQLKTKQPSYTNEYAFIKLLAEPSTRDDLVAVVERLADGQRFEIELSWLQAVDKQSSDYQILEDFGLWQVNWH